MTLWTGARSLPRPLPQMRYAHVPHCGWVLWVGLTEAPLPQDDGARPSQEQIAEMMVCHAQELQELQDQYE